VQIVKRLKGLFQPEKVVKASAWETVLVAPRKVERAVKSCRPMYRSEKKAVSKMQKLSRRINRGLR